MAGRKRRSSTTDELCLLSLSAYGAAFMAMFDDFDASKVIPPPQSSSEAEPSSSSGQDDSSDESDHSKGMRGDQPAQPGGTTAEDLLYGTAHKVAAAAGPSSGGADSRPPAARSQQRVAEERRMRKQFMSPKAHAIFGDDATAAAGGGGAAGNGDAAAAAEFQRMQREVELLGASALDKRASKAWKANMLGRIGASAGKSPRVAASIGAGMARKAKEREATALEARIEAGMASRKGLGKKRRADKAAVRDPGLLEAGPSFKKGVLRISKAPRTTENHGPALRPVHMGGGSGGGRGDGGAAKRGKHKGSKKKGGAKKGHKRR